MTTTIRHDDAADFAQGLRGFFAYRGLGVTEATGGGFGAHVIRAVAGEGPKPEWHLHELEFQLVYVLRGWVEFEYADIGFVRLEAGSSALQAPRVAHREIRHSDDLEMLEVTQPASFVTRTVAAPG